MRIFDSHAHYFDRRFDGEYEGGAEALLNRILPGEVSNIINVGTDIRTSRLAVEMAGRHEGMYAAVGIHPGDCHYVIDIDGALADLENMISDPEQRRRDKIVAVGEIGLDYHFSQYGEIPMDQALEERVFRAQMQLAERYRLPVIIHDREAHNDCMRIVLEYPGVAGVFHSFSGSGEMAQELCKRGWYISFSGTLTFTNARRVRTAALAVPRDRLLVETDCPYLAPHPHRGELNHSGLLVHTLGTLAELWETTPEIAADITAQNAKRLFLD